MSEIPTILAIRKRKDRKLTIVLSIVAWVICVVVDWTFSHLFHWSNMISCALVVAVLSLLNAFIGFWVWRRLDGKERWVIYRAIIASVMAIFIVPTRAGPLTIPYVLSTIFGIALGAYFGMPIQRLVVAIERKSLKRSQQEPTDS